MMAQASWRDRRHPNSPRGPVGVKGTGEEVSRPDLSICYEKDYDVEVAQTDLGGADGWVTASVTTPWLASSPPESRLGGLNCAPNGVQR